MRAFVLVCAAVLLAWYAPNLAILSVSPFLIGALLCAATGAFVGYTVGRNVGHRDTAKGLPALYVHRMLGRAS